MFAKISVSTISVITSGGNASTSHDTPPNCFMYQAERGSVIFAGFGGGGGNDVCGQWRNDAILTQCEFGEVGKYRLKRGHGRTTANGRLAAKIN